MARSTAEQSSQRADILQAAERLVADKRYLVVSIRDIANSASAPIALSRYCFGRKEDLFRTIFETHRHNIDERCEAMRWVAGRPGAARAARVIRAWTEPVLRERAGYDPLAQAFVSAMCEALPASDRATVVWSYQFTVGALLTFIADSRVERLSNGSETTADPARGEQLIDFITAGFLTSANPGRRG